MIEPPAPGWPSGVYTGLEDSGEVVFHPLPKPSDADIEKLVKSLHKRMIGLFQRLGLLGDGEYEELTSLGLCQVAARRRASPECRVAFRSVPVGMTSGSAATKRTLDLKRNADCAQTTAGSRFTQRFASGQGNASA